MTDRKLYSLKFCPTYIHLRAFHNTDMWLCEELSTFENYKSVQAKTEILSPEIWMLRRDPQ